MTSEQLCYVWKWLKGSTEPVPAGVISVNDDGEMSFRYGRKYLERKDKEPIYAEELPLVDETFFARDIELNNFSSIRDAAPDAWGRRVIHSKLEMDPNELLSEMTYMMNSSSDRIGSIDFQSSPTEFVPRGEEQATLEELQSAADIILSGNKLPVELDKALLHGTSLGGARPKAMIIDASTKYIAKFSASNDTYDIVKSEYIAMKLAKLCGINVAEVKLVHSAGKDALLVKRFDRTELEGKGWMRHSMISGLTVLGLDESLAHYCSYPELVEKMQRLCKFFSQDARELYKRVVFNVLVGNTDDHARNHAFFVDGEQLNLTPAYDICPQSRTGGEAGHGMIIVGNSNKSSIENCLKSAPTFHIKRDDAIEIISQQITVINGNFGLLCDEIDLSDAGRRLLWKRAILNDYIFYGNEDFKELVTFSL
ncbi:HipA domain-containing protein [Vibrio sp. JC009]|uniref:type II toxin-antitoxin system HipA family toxin n=1 Tax=Vibrio sp. JC009 TaxID=2912314 RepID=UPI0023AFECE4|nr:HipA domain-containing protein [Vibrio sp. JC009]WED21978.1 HipA domain-containing protein [Vibrio sp. JC009]